VGLINANKILIEKSEEIRVFGIPGCCERIILKQLKQEAGCASVACVILARGGGSCSGIL
jgi:hypothetical protein